ncbi:MAG: hypothetical protein N2Z22_06835 [Turneriella sp.]|nr:hypothetical protein [Turneriella sp.]
MHSSQITLLRRWLLACALVCGQSYAAPPLTDAVNTQTAVTLKRGDFSVAGTLYDGGGILNRNILGVHDNIYLGVAFDAENAIGDANARLNIPGVIAKAKLTDGWSEFPLLLAVGYDAFYAGRRGKVETDNPYYRVIFGPYFTLTKPIYLLGDEQHVHVGIRTPVQPVYTPQDTELYLGIDFPMGYFVPIFEIQRIFFNSNRLREMLFNLGLRLHLFEHLAIELDLIMGIGQRTNRMVVLEYFDRF